MQYPSLPIHDEIVKQCAIWRERLRPHARWTGQKAALHMQLYELTAMIHSEKVGEVAGEFYVIHTVERAQRVGSLDRLIPAASLRPCLIEALER